MNIIFISWLLDMDKSNQMILTGLETFYFLAQNFSLLELYSTT
jgi:hypothetical protein